MLVEFGSYRFEFAEQDGSRSYQKVIVLEWSAPLAKVHDGSSVWIVNLSSSQFVQALRAEPYDHARDSLMRVLGD